MSLKDRLIRQISADGPIPFSTYMQIALHDPFDGYYATRPGIASDFATAPEISPLFGELIGLWLVHEWLALESPSQFRLVEIGPGRGTLMDDALRLAKEAGGQRLQCAMQLSFVEVSPVLKSALTDRFAAHGPEFYDSLGAVPEGPMLLIANEYLDCLPVRQFHRSQEGWRECVVGLDPQGELAPGLSADSLGELPHAPDTASVFEVQPALDLLIADLVCRRSPFRGLFIDYGPMDGAPGDSVRAYYRGQQISPFERPGESDLTADVDFGRLARLARAAGLAVAGPAPQGQFLLGLGAQARLNQLIQASPEMAEKIFANARRLIDPADLGERFKAICISSPGLDPPAGL